MNLKECTKCGNSKPLNAFNYKNKEERRLNARCKECTRRDVMASYYKSRNYYLERTALRNKQRYIELKQYIHKFLIKHPCVDCGIKDYRVLQFDHVRGNKINEVSSMMKRGCTLKKLKQEMKKCDIRCANCHIIKTIKERDYYAYIPH